MPVAVVLRWQSAYCRSVGAPLAAAICDAVADDYLSDRRLSALLPAESRFGDLMSLRLMAVVHRLALERRAPLVALHVPTLGGTVPRDAAALAQWQHHVVQTLVDHPDEVAAALARTPQTNEPGRAAVLRAGLSRLTLPVRLREVGASAGLNLRADLLPGNAELERGPLPPVIDRLGCDLAPIDPTSQEGRLSLTSFVWVDHVARFERLRYALTVAASTPAEVVTSSAGDFVEELALADDCVTVLWHSAVWSYLDAGEQRRVESAIERLGSAASATRPFAHVSWEWPAEGGDEFVGVLQLWNGDSHGAPVVIARGSSHGDDLRQ